MHFNTVLRHSGRDFGPGFSAVRAFHRQSLTGHRYGVILPARIDVAVSRIDDNVLEPSLHAADGLPRLAAVGALNQTTNECVTITVQTTALAGSPQNVAVVGIGSRIEEPIESRRKAARQRRPRRA